MDGCNVESRHWMSDDFAGLHELLRDEDGGTPPGNGPSGLPRHHKEGWQQECLDWSYSPKLFGSRCSATLARTQASLRKFDVRSISRRDSNRFRAQGLDDYGASALAHVSDPYQATG